MRKNMLLFVCFLFIQTTTGQQRTTHLQLHLGYGTENNFGSTAFFGGLGLIREMANKWNLGVGVTRFTTAIYNAYDGEDFDGEQQDYKDWFLTPEIGYCLIGKHQSFFSARLAAGPSLKYFNYKIFRTGLIRYYFDGRREAIDSTLRWYEDKGVNISLYTGIAFQFRFSPKLNVQLFADAYSHEIWIEHFMPGIRVQYRMGRKE